MSKKILLAEDDADARAALRRILQDYELLEASDGKEALKLAGREKPDVILLDVNMPVMDGMEVLRRIRAAGPKPLAIMITADSSKETVQRAMTEGVFAYVIKPLEKALVQEQVRRAFDFLENARD